MNPRRVQPRRAPRRPRVWPPLIAASVAVLLVGCASPHTSSSGTFSRAVEEPAALTDRSASRPGAWRIAQQRTGGDPTFRLVAIEPPPTPKTVAASGSPIASRAIAAPEGAAPSASAERLIEPPRAPRGVQTRVREPVGAVYFPSAGSQVSRSALPTVAAALARAGRADRFVLTAYTDPHGPLDLNRRLADLRAESVATALTARGVEPAQLIVLSRPQCCATQPLPERDAAPYRRVDIEVLTHRRVLSEDRGDGPQHHS